MSWQPVVIDNFGGLDIADDPQQAGLEQAIDCLNTDPSVRGKLRCRPGSQLFTPTTGIPQEILPWRNGTDDNIVVSASNGIFVYDGPNAPPLSSASDVTTSMVVFGQPGATRVYYASGVAGIGRINTAYAFGTVLASPPTTYLAVTPADNRLVSADTDTVYFSDAGDPETFGANNFVQLDPGDGESIVDLVAWRDIVVAFKQTKFFVFGGTATSPTGTPEFPYRAVKNSVGIDRDTLNSVVSTRDGIYFLAGDGIYRTRGEEPVKVSGRIDAWFADRVDQLSAHVPATTSERYTLGADSRRLYFGTAHGTFVLDFETGLWTVWSFNVRAVAVGYVDGTKRTVLGLTSSVVSIAQQFTTDQVGPGPSMDIEWFYRTGAADLGVAAVKVVRQVQVWGVGAPGVAVYVDHGITDAGTAAVQLGVGGVERGVQSYARRGTFFSVALTGKQGDIVSRVQPDIREARLVGVG